jgi:2,4-dienoyl-CoA reductase-like NADH-dependent reductase (Old Yellow Enzyme family)
MSSIFSPLTLSRGPALKSRLLLAPLTNKQSHVDGTMSSDEYHFLTKRAEGGFALVMTCAAHVQACGQGFPGQLGVFGDQHLEGLRRLAAGIRERGSVSSVQLHHAGCRSPKELVPTPVCPSDNAELGARGLTLAEVETLREDFVSAAVRCDTAGFDGVEIHGAHGYILAQFLSSETNQREDKYGGSLENRSRIIHEIIAGIRARCRPEFQLGLRISPERFGVKLGEMVDLARSVLATGSLDYLDVSLWDVGKAPEEEPFRTAHPNKKLIDYFTELDRGSTRLGVAGKIRTPADATATLAAGVDFVMLGRAAILNHDFPHLAAADPGWVPTPTPVTRAHLRQEGLGPAFVEYMAGWGGFVAAAEEGEGQ